MSDFTADGPSQFDLNDDDYDYLIKDDQIINTCKEALLEVPCHESRKLANENDTNCYMSAHELDTISSGPSSLSSTASSVCTLINRADLKTSCFLLDFNQWLTYTEKRVKSVCCCHEVSDAYRRQRVDTMNTTQTSLVELLSPPFDRINAANQSLITAVTPTVTSSSKG